MKEAIDFSLEKLSASFNIGKKKFQAMILVII